ncbi:hypothetical protein E2C01_019553 [Portunus trituberculatus]|uniref:Uncharacterized protein n=1 Tax=Portunus trituberculatus TaxID=210409 RepID=A0A5B7E0R5_PORTR|nr:hypothetical protein [Portunus trituberculatus]
MGHDALTPLETIRFLPRMSSLPPVNHWTLTPVLTSDNMIRSFNANVSPCFILILFLSRHFMAYILPVSALRHPYTSPKPPRPMIRLIPSRVPRKRFFRRRGEDGASVGQEEKVEEEEERAEASGEVRLT